MALQRPCANNWVTSPALWHTVQKEAQTAERQLKWTSWDVLRRAPTPTGPIHQFGAIGEFDVPASTKRFREPGASQPGGRPAAVACGRQLRSSSHAGLWPHQKVGPGRFAGQASFSAPKTAWMMESMPSASSTSSGQRSGLPSDPGCAAGSHSREEPQAVGCPSALGMASEHSAGMLASAAEATWLSPARQRSSSESRLASNFSLGSPLKMHQAASSRRAKRDYRGPGQVFTLLLT